MRPTETIDDTFQRDAFSFAGQFGPAVLIVHCGVCAPAARGGLSSGASFTVQTQSDYATRPSYTRHRAYKRGTECTICRRRAF